MFVHPTRDEDTQMNHTLASLIRKRLFRHTLRRRRDFRLQFLSGGFNLIRVKVTRKPSNKS